MVLSPEAIGARSSQQRRLEVSSRWVDKEEGAVPGESSPLEALWLFCHESLGDGLLLKTLQLTLFLPPGHLGL